MQDSQNSERISVSVLTDLRGADKAAKAYAFLYAAFRKTEISQNPVRDALDCITPFIAPYLNQIAGKQIDVQAVQNFLRTTIGFDIPLYALEQVIPSLAKAGLAEYHQAARVYFAKKSDALFDIVKSEIETDFDQVEHQLDKFAKSLDPLRASSYHRNQDQGSTFGPGGGRACRGGCLYSQSARKPIWDVREAAAHIYGSSR
jgi:hypothetical protein